MGKTCICFMFLLFLATAFAYENIALYKPAYQQYPYIGDDSESVNASKAVDGIKTDMSPWGGQCVLSENRRHSATWWVDLTRIASISHIIIHYMTGNQQWGPSNDFTSNLLGFSIYVSNTSDRLEGALCFKDIYYNLSTIQNTINITCAKYGQYVIFYNERQKGHPYPEYYSKFAFNELCEVEVFGLYNCSIQCPDPNCHCCKDEMGICQSCKPGYQGDHCELEIKNVKDTGLNTKDNSNDKLNFDLQKFYNESYNKFIEMMKEMFDVLKIELNETKEIVDGLKTELNEYKTWLSSGTKECQCMNPTVGECVSDCHNVCDGDYQSCSTCSGYVTCANYYLWDRPCPGSLVWDDNLKRCEVTSNCNIQ